MCYHARLQDKEDYEVKVVKQFKPPLDLMEGQAGNIPLTQAQFQAEIRW